MLIGEKKDEKKDEKREEKKENNKNIPSPDRIDTGPSISLSDALSQRVSKI